jgi:hypothetical protein
MRFVCAVLFAGLAAWLSAPADGAEVEINLTRTSAGNKYVTDNGGIGTVWAEVRPKNFTPAKGEDSPVFKLRIYKTGVSKLFPNGEIKSSDDLHGVGQTFKVYKLTVIATGDITWFCLSDTQKADSSYVNVWELLDGTENLVNADYPYFDPWFGDTGESGSGLVTVEWFDAAITYP